MARYIDFAVSFIILFLMVHLEQLVLHKRAFVVEGRMEAQFEKCCGLGTSWAQEGLRCEKFTGPVTGVPAVQQGLCLEAVDICCVRAYHELQCEKGKADARKGLACVTSTSSQKPPKTLGRGDYHRDCCEGCKLGILAGSMGQGCSFKSFSFGIPWDPAFLECCHEASPSSTTDLTSELSSESSTETDQDFSSPSSPISSYSPSSSSSSSSPWSSSSSSPWSSSSSPSSSSSSSPWSSSSSSSSSSSPSSPTSPLSTSSDNPSSTSSDSTPYSIPTPELDDICQLMKGILCSDICVPTPGSYRCECRDGFTLLEDGKTCKQDQPIDRCKPTHPCQHRCTDNGVAVVCSCKSGYDLAEDARSCIPRSRTKKMPDKNADNELLPSCPTGYRYNATNQVCDDVDECLERNVCPGGCQNTIGSYICIREKSVKDAPYEACPPGYEWQPLKGECTDIDECVVLPAACAAGKPFCVNTQGSYACLEMTGVKSCPAGFKFDKLSQLCKDVDECAEDIHSCLADVEQCRNTEGAYECDMKCGKGFTYSIGLGVCVDVDECVESRNPCPDPSTICVNTKGAYECTKTTANYFPIDQALSDHQKNVQSGSRMTCSAGYKSSNDSGITRCIDVDECNEQLHSCELDERCINEIGRYRCVAIENNGDTSTTEEINDDQPDDQFSREYKLERTSISSVNNEIEDCGDGYFFDRKSGRCIDVDECANRIATCGIGERCVNTEGGYRCSPTCPPGFRMRNNSRSVNEAKEFCEDIDECLLGLHTCNDLTHYCINTNGSYVCGTRTTTASLIETTMSSTATRRSFVGSRYNKVQGTDRYWSTEPCRLGYKRDASTGYCVDIDECAVGPGCREHERCTNTPGGYDCSPLCSAGWYFSTTTKSCQDVDECLLGRHDCPQSTHRCINANGSFICELIPPCSRGYRRVFNGTCLDIDECSENLHNCRLNLHQYCVNKEGSFECLTRLPSCPSGYKYSLSTLRCEDVDECLIGQYSCDARFSERCVNLPGTYRCERPPPPRQRQRPACPSGYRYHPNLRRCTDIDECAEGLDMCGDNEICYNQPGGYSCAKSPIPVTRRPTTTAMPAPVNQKCMRGTRFVRNRGCVDVNECRELEDACSSNEECVNTVGSYTCTCKTGFRRDNLTQACVDINECQLKENDCLPTQRCDNTIGSYTCTRFLPCGTGYTLNAATEICEDDDECVLGTHDCGSGYQCRNTLGSYRCDRIPRIPTPQPRTSPMTTMRIATVTTTTPTSLTPAGPSSWPNCPRGFEPGSSGKCVDIDECRKTPSPCARSMCINTLGSYRCASRVICGPGYTLDPVSGQYCVDVDECQEGTHKCGKGQTCENRQGGYHCICPSGHAVGPNNDCVDIDECSIYGGSNICGMNGRCENTVGSYKCVCSEGFENTAGGIGACQDIDECQRTPGLCQHVCLNVWGSYRCGCEAGFRLNADNRSCNDIDECTEFKDHHLCIGICDNTPGSYACKCPEGYRLGVDGRTCQDIDECAAGQVCRQPDEMCQNTRGSYRCFQINCPSGYHRDPMKKNRCVRSRICHGNELACHRTPSHYSYNFITFVSMLPLPSTGQLELFTLRGSHQPDSTIQFTMALVDVRAPPGVARATESCFALKRPIPSQAVLVLTRSIPGPQEIELDLSMEVYHDSVFVGSAVAKIFIFVSQYEF